MGWLGEDADMIYVIRHSFHPHTGKFMSKSLLGLQCQYNLFSPFVCQFQFAAPHIWLIRLRRYTSLGVSLLKYSRAHKNPIKRYDVSTISAPSSKRSNGIVFPVLPFIKCG